MLENADSYRFVRAILWTRMVLVFHEFNYRDTKNNERSYIAVIWQRDLNIMFIISKIIVILIFLHKYLPALTTLTNEFSNSCLTVSIVSNFLVNQFVLKAT